MLHRRLAVVATLILCGGVIGSAQAPASPPRGGGAAVPGPGPAQTPLAAPTAAGKITGRVIAADTGKPLKRAVVTLFVPQTRTTRITQTDAGGRYMFGDLRTAGYTVTASKPGYVVFAYGQQRAFEDGRGIRLTEGQSLENIDILLPRGGVITGRITDEFGEPIAGVLVQAGRYQFRPSGERQLMQGGFRDFLRPSMTDDRGEYRIYGLLPSNYVVSATTGTASAVALTQPGGANIDVESNQGQPTTYYPGTINAADAGVVSVGLMRETSVSFSLLSTRMARISGVVRDSRNRPASGVAVELRPTGGMTSNVQFSGGPSQTSSTGSFAMANVAPGGYTLDVWPMSALRASAAGLPRSEFASVPIAVGSDDITDALIVTHPGISISGRVIFEGKSEEMRRSLRISAVPEEIARNVVANGGMEGVDVDQDGQFHIPSVFGSVVIRTGPLPATVMLKSVTLNGIDITNSTFDATKSADVTGVQVVLTDKAGEIDGFARNARGEIPTDYYRLVVYPFNPPEGEVTVRFQHNTGPNPQGHFHIGRMPPGDYIGLAVKGLPLGEEWSPDLRKRIEQYGKRFTLEEGQALEIDLPYVE